MARSTLKGGHRTIEPQFSLGASYSIVIQCLLRTPLAQYGHYLFLEYALILSGRTIIEQNPYGNHHR